MVKPKISAKVVTEKILPPEYYTNEMWYRGELREMCKDAGQKKIYDWIKGWEACHNDDPGPLVLNVQREGGKSGALALIAMERCLKYSYEFIAFVGPSQEQVEGYLPIIIDEICRVHKCPEELKPRFIGGDTWIFRNPTWKDPNATSVLKIMGTMGDVNKKRGPRGNVVIFDEGGFIDNFQYVMASVYASFLSGKPRPLMILSSTPPPTTAHPYITQYIREALADNRYFKMSVLENPAWTPADTKRMVKIIGPIDSIAWRREMMCELIGDPDSLAISEFPDHKKNIVVKMQRPESFIPVEGIDFGCNDWTAVIFAYVDYLEQLLVVEDELVRHFMSTGEFAKLWKAKEYDLYGNEDKYGQKNYGTPLYSRIRRWADNDSQLILDYRRDHHIEPITPADKRGWESVALARFKYNIQQENIRIHPRCTTLIGQIEGGSLNKQRTGFERQSIQEFNQGGPGTPLIGHCDALSAIMYLNRMVVHYFGINPYPDKRAIRTSTWFPSPIHKPDISSGLKIGNKPITITNNPL